MMMQRNTMMNKKPISGGLGISPKTMAMIVLLSVMGILWGRVLLKGSGGPASAKAQEQINSQNGISEALPKSVQIEPVLLPVLPGRNDKITHDMFTGENWNAFDLEQSQNSANGGVKVDTQSNVELEHRSRLERIAERLKLEAVICDAQNRPYQAFVENKILSVGSMLTVQEGPDQYVLKVEKISEKEVTFSWNEMSVILKMAETFEF